MKLKCKKSDVLNALNFLTNRKKEDIRLREKCLKELLLYKTLEEEGKLFTIKAKPNDKVYVVFMNAKTKEHYIKEGIVERLSEQVDWTKENESKFNIIYYVSFLNSDEETDIVGIKAEDFCLHKQEAEEAILKLKKEV